MSRCLIAYYSLTGTTAKIAMAIASRLSTDLEPIQERQAPARRRRAFPFRL